MIAALVSIVFVIVAPDGSLRQHVEERKSLDVCFAEARKFVLRDPAEFGGIALGAGCLVAGRPS